MFAFKALVIYVAWFSYKFSSVYQVLSNEMKLIVNLPWFKDYDLFIPIPDQEYEVNIHILTF